MAIPTTVFKKDSARRIDRVIDYFGGSPTLPRGNCWSIHRVGPPRRGRIRVRPWRSTSWAPIRIAPEIS